MGTSEYLSKGKTVVTWGDHARVTPPPYSLSTRVPPVIKPTELLVRSYEADPGVTCLARGIAKSFERARWVELRLRHVFDCSRTGLRDCP